MATRNSVTRRLPGNALGGVLRATAHAARSTTRRSVSIPGPEGPQGVQGPAGVTATPVATAVTSDFDGRARWDFPEMDPAPLVVATPVTDLPVFATLIESGPSHAEFAVWHCDGTPFPGVTLNVVALQVGATSGVNEPESATSAAPVD